jgi:hypothetical protein
MEKFVIPNSQGGALGTLAKFSGVNNIIILNGKQLQQSNPYAGQQGISDPVTKDAPLRTSVLGTPIYTDLTLQYCSYTDNITGQTVSVDDDIVLDTVLLTVSQPIKVIKTEIQGRDGTVKEYIGKGDAEITINGIITGTNGVYPRDDVSELKKWLDAPISKGVLSWWLQNLGIHNIVVNSYSIPQVQGGYSYQMFSISASSDAPVELRITTPPSTPPSTSPTVTRQ